MYNSHCRESLNKGLAAKLKGFIEGFSFLYIITDSIQGKILPIKIFFYRQFKLAVTVLASAIRNGYGRYEKVVLLSDGAGWIVNMKDELFGEGVLQILDFFHLSENVYSYGKAKFKMIESQYIPWADEKCRKLRDGKWKEVLGELDPEETYKNTVNP